MNLTQNFNSIKINAGIRYGSEIAEKYKVRGYPTVIFIDKEGKEIDRIIGYAPPDEYIPMVNDILDGKNTISSLEEKLVINPKEYNIIFKLGEKYLDKGESDISQKYFIQFLKNAPIEMSEEIISAKFALAKYRWENSDISGLENFVIDYPEASQSISAYQMIARYYTTENDTAMEVATLFKMTEKFPENYSAMNSYAWRMTELNQNLNDALVKAKVGVQLAPEGSKAMILDTQAEVEWLLGDIESAILTIEKAINLNPEDEYYQAQLEKFKGNN